MSALLTADEAARLVPGERLVIVRAGDRREGSLHPMGAYSRSVAQAARNETRYVAPKAWVALTGPCPDFHVAKNDKGIWCAWLGERMISDHANYDGAVAAWRNLTRAGNPECRDGRRIVPLYTECLNHPHHCMIVGCDGKRLAGRGSIEVVPVVDVHGMCEEVIAGRKCVAVLDARLWLIEPGKDRIVTELAYEVEPVPGRDWGIVIDCVEVAS